MSHRIERVNHLIRREISELILRHVKDPRLTTFLSINKVETSADFRHARIYVSCIESTEHREEILAALVKAAGYIRRELAASLKLRRTPELSFVWDSSIEEGERVLRLLDEVSGETEKEEPE